MQGKSTTAHVYNKTTCIEWWDKAKEPVAVKYTGRWNKISNLFAHLHNIRQNHTNWDLCPAKCICVYCMKWMEENEPLNSNMLKTQSFKSVASCHKGHFANYHLLDTQVSPFHLINAKMFPPGTSASFDPFRSQITFLPKHWSLYLILHSVCLNIQSCDTATAGEG